MGKEVPLPEPVGKGKGIDMAEPTASEEGEFDVNAYLYPLPTEE